MNKRYVLAGLLTTFLGYVDLAEAQQVAQPPGGNLYTVELDSPSLPKSFGTQDLSVKSINFTAFRPLDNGSADRFNGGISEVTCPGSCALAVPVNLPSGVIIEELEVIYNDDSPNHDITFTFFSCPDFACIGGPGLSSSGTPGNVVDSLSLNVLVENSTTSYYIFAFIEDDFALNTTPALFGARLYYRRQVSPAPATATFDDVPPSDPFFQVIEALVASGITGGCSVNPPLFCPDATVTRAQMAAFLARALGLHFPN